MTEQADSHHDLADGADVSVSASEALGLWRRDGQSNGQAAEAASPDAAGRALGGKRVLIADDEGEYRRSVTDMLSSSGCRIDVASDGAEACELLADNRYDLVITDVSMPGATGYDVFVTAKAAHRDTGVILMTAFSYDPDHAIVRALKAGAGDVLLKPFPAEDLLKRCDGLLAGAEA